MEYDITDLSGITENSVEHFQEEGFDDVQSIYEASFDEVMDVKYMREERAEQILDSADELIGEEEDGDRENKDLVYDPAEDEWVEELPPNFHCDCGSIFQSKAVYMAHENICKEV